MADRTRSDDQYLDLPEDDSLRRENTSIIRCRKRRSSFYALKRQQGNDREARSVNSRN